MMIMSLRDKDIHTKRETGLDTSNIATTTTVPNGKYNTKSNTTATTSSSSTRLWSGFKNPRIVRVSRTFGGKDRHSKVCTIRGLRDRRIRLSVPTAIQLYDLQDRLGLSQPSKVIDWLLDSTKFDIDQLPPLQIPPDMSFDQFHQAAAMDSNGCQPHHQQQTHNNSSSLTPFLDVNLAINMDKASNVNVQDGCEDEEYEHDAGGGGGVGGQVSAQNFFPINAGDTFLSGLLASNSMPYSYYQWDPSSIALTQFGGIGSMPSSQDHQDGDQNVANNNNSSATMANIQQGAHQLFFCPSTSLFPTTYGNASGMQVVAGNDNSRFQQWPSSSSLSPTMKSFPFGNNHEMQSHDQSNGTDDQASKDEENG